MGNVLGNAVIVAFVVMAVVLFIFAVDYILSTPSLVEYPFEKEAKIDVDVPFASDLADIVTGKHGYDWKIRAGNQDYYGGACSRLSVVDGRVLKFERVERDLYRYRVNTFLINIKDITQVHYWDVREAD